MHFTEWQAKGYYIYLTEDKTPYYVGMGKNKRAIPQETREKIRAANKKSITEYWAKVKRGEIQRTRRIKHVD